MSCQLYALKYFYLTYLVSGLGIGTSATSFMRHGINTTIVEIDPAVYRAAREWFALPDPGAGQVYLEDARGWAAKKKASIETGNKETRYDIVVHDCFSGGGVPEHIYTLEFWNDLKSSMQEEGIIVVVSTLHHRWINICN